MSFSDESQLRHSMRHRHLDTQEFTLAAIDDIIDRGKMKDWLELRDALRATPKLAEAVRHICRHHEDDQNIRYNFWLVYLDYIKSGGIRVER